VLTGVGLRKHLFHAHFPHADVDECSLKLDNCESTAICDNSPGSYRCLCRAGYRMLNGICQGEIAQLLKLTR